MGKRRNLVVIIFFLLSLFPFFHFVQAQESEQIKVVVYGIDGLNNYRFDEALTPNFEYVMNHGAWTMHCLANTPLVSSPNWKSIISGVTPQDHRVMENGFDNSVYKDNPTCPSEPEVFPTIFTLSKRAYPERKVGYFEHWGAFRKLVRGDKIDRHFWWEFAPGPVVNRAMVFYKKKKTAITFIHVDQCDHAGHAYGHESPEYVEAVELADEQLGKILRTINEKDGFESTYLLVVTDHGGEGHGHGAGSAKGFYTPWMIMGPGIKEGYEIKGEFKNEDTAATIMKCLGIELHECWTATAVEEAFE